MERHHNAIFKVFDAPLAFYKWKDNLKDIATAFGLDNEGTIPELMSCIKDHMDRNPSLAQQPHFSNLYSTCCLHKHPTTFNSDTTAPCLAPPPNLDSSSAPSSLIQIPIDPLLL